MEINLAIFASGSGTNAENIIKYFQKHDTINTKVIVTNNPNAFVIQRAKQLSIDCVVVNKSEWKDPLYLLSLLKSYRIDYIILAGFLLRIPNTIIDNYTNKVINIHPALLPKHGGKGMYGDNVHKSVVKLGDTESGITIHYCNEQYDKGDIIFQAKCEVLPTDTFEDVANKVHQLEYKYFPKVIEEVLMQFNIKGR